MEESCDLCDFEHGMIAGDKWAGIEYFYNCQSNKLCDSHINISRNYFEWCYKGQKNKTSTELLQLGEWKLLVDVKDQWRKARLT